MLEEPDLQEMGVSSEKERGQILEAAKGLAAKVMSAYIPPPPANPSTPTHNNNNVGDGEEKKEPAPVEDNIQVSFHKPVASNCCPRIKNYF